MKKVREVLRKLVGYRNFTFQTALRGKRRGYKLLTSFNLVVVTPRASYFAILKKRSRRDYEIAGKGESWKTNGRGEYIQQQD